MKKRNIKKEKTIHKAKKEIAGETKQITPITPKPIKRSAAISRAGFKILKQNCSTVTFISRIKSDVFLDRVSK